VSDERPVMAKLLRDAGSDTGKLVEIVDCLHALTNAGTNDPRLEDSAGPWLWLIKRLIVIDPAVAANGARSWYRSIFMASLNLEEGLANRPFIANLAGLTAAHVHEDVKAEHHLMSGQVEVHGNAGSSAAATMRGGRVFIAGDTGARAGISMKGGTLVVGGSVGYMSGFMMQRGAMIVCGDAADGIGDSMYEGTVYVGGAIASLGADCIEAELGTDDPDQLRAVSAIYRVSLRR